MSTNFTNFTASILATAQTVTLATPSSSVTIYVAAGGAAIYIDFTGSDATTNSFMIPAGSSFSYVGPLIAHFSYIGASASGTYSVFAHSHFISHT